MPLTVSEVSPWLHHCLALNLIKKKEKKALGLNQSSLPTLQLGFIRTVSCDDGMKTRVFFPPLVFAVQHEKKRLLGGNKKKIPGIHLVNA